MQRNKTYLLGVGTLFSALAIGYVMQFGFGLPRSATPAVAQDVTVTGITPTSSVVPSMPADIALTSDLPQETIELAKLDTAAPDVGPLPQDDAGAGFACDVTLTASPAAGAMVSLVLNAPCQRDERVTFHHHGLMFTEVTGTDGTLSIDVPAMAETAMFIASFDNGEGAVAQANVTSVPFYDRIAVQWKGDSGLQLHAREFSAAYFADGHVWSASSGDIKRTAEGKGGFLTSLGHDNSPGALRAEVYSYPAGITQMSGQIAMTVEAEITAANCDKDVEAQTLELHEGGPLRVRDLSLSMPECDTVGDFLVLKNLVKDLTIAAN